MQKISQETINQIAIFLILLVCYIYTFPRWADPNQNSRLNMVVAVVEDGTFRIDDYVQNTVDYAKVGDHYYSDKAPGAAFLGIPIYAGLAQVLELPVLDPLMAKLSNNSAFQSTLKAEGSGIFEQKVRFALAQVLLTIFIAAIPSALLGVLLYLVLGKFTPNNWFRLAIALGYGLLTPAFAYAGAFYGHQLSAALLFGVFYLLFVQPKALPTWILIIIGLLLGYSVVTEYPTALLVIILYLYAFYVLWQQGTWLRIGWVTLSGALVAVLWMGYNTAIFGGPLELGYSYSELWVDQHHTGFMSLSLPHWQAVWGITFGLFRGLFVLSPWLLFALPGFWLWWRSGRYRVEFIVVLLCIVVTFFFNSSSIMWWGGFAIGPRYLLPALPFMAIPVVFVYNQWGNRLWLRGLGGALYLWSFIAVWGLTLANQAFPSDTIKNPLLLYALPNWLHGNIARNVGTILGLPGTWSLLPLALMVIGLALIWWLLAKKTAKMPGTQNDRQALSPTSTEFI